MVVYMDPLGQITVLGLGISPSHPGALRERLDEASASSLAEYDF